MPSANVPNVGERRQALWYLILLWIPLLGLLVGLLPSGTSSTLRLVQGVLFALLAAEWLTFGVRGLRSGISMDDEGLTSYRQNWTSRLLWRDIERFELRPSTRLWLVAIRQNGRPVRLQLYRSKYEGEATSAIHLLNGELHRRSKTPSP
jgi:hypothetical protein